MAQAKSTGRREVRSAELEPQEPRCSWGRRASVSLAVGHQGGLGPEAFEARRKAGLICEPGGAALAGP